MMLINNALGKVLASFSGVVILALLFSLLESKFILPSHLARLSLDRTGDEGRLSWIWQGMQGYAQCALEGFRTGIYQPALEWSLQQRYAVAMLFVTFATLGLGLIYAGKIKAVFFPDISSQVITVNLEMDARAPYRLTLANADRIETIGRSINAELQSRYQLDEKPIRHILLVVNGAYSVNLYAELAPADQRLDPGTLDILRQWQDRTGRLEGAVKLTFSGSEELAGGFAIDLYSKNEDSLKAASRELMEWLQALKGVSNLREGLKNGKPELSLLLKPEARLCGFSNDSLARQIGQRFGGVEAQRMQRDGQEIKVLVQGSADAADSIADLMQSRLKSDKGQWYPLLDVARIESAYSPDYIARRNGQRVNTIQADINKALIAPAKISLDMFTQLIPGMEKNTRKSHSKWPVSLKKWARCKSG
jgi:multidrug efflux pump subunit AcrB